MYSTVHDAFAPQSLNDFFKTDLFYAKNFTHLHMIGKEQTIRLLI